MTPEGPEEGNRARTGEMVSLFVKATDKDEARMRAKLTGMKLENLRKERDCWRKRAEIKKRLQDRKEEAWQLFRTQAGLRPKLREEFEREYTRKVTRGSWAEELLNNALAEERKREARESQKMGQEDASSQQCQSWDKLHERYALSSLLRTV